MQPTRIDSLTSLRFFAAAIIVVGHGNRLFGSAGLTYLAGDQAVSFFFVLSGFILAHTYDDRLNSREEVKRYYVARLARVWPTHIACAIGAVVLIEGARAPLHVLATNIFLLQSWVPSMSYFFSANGVSWSISVEALFYVLLPALLLKLRSRWLLNLATSIALALAIVLATFTKGKEIAYWAAYIFPPTRLPEFVLGICAYRLHVSRDLSPTYRQATMFEAAAVITAIACMRLCRMASEHILAAHASQSGISDWLMSGAGGLPFALLIFAFSNQRGALSRALCNKFWVQLGEASFALYMVHQIIFRMMWERYTLVTSFPKGMMWSLYAALSLTLAFGLHFLFEKPARRAIMSWFDSRKAVQPRIGTGA